MQEGYKIRKVGTSQVITLPKALMDALKWKVGDAVDIEIIGVGAIKVSKK